MAAFEAWSTKVLVKFKSLKFNDIFIVYYYVMSSLSHNPGQGIGCVLRDSYLVTYKKKLTNRLSVRIMIILINTGNVIDSTRITVRVVVVVQKFNRRS